VNRPNTPPAARLLDLMLRQRVVIAAALAGLTALCWLYLFVAAADMRAMGAMAMPMPMAPKGAVDLVLLLVMWWVMMAGMMLPGAAPMILVFAPVNRRRRARGKPYAPTALFAAGYLLAWGGFSVAATLAQWGLERLALLSPMDMTTTSSRFITHQDPAAAEAVEAMREAHAQGATGAVPQVVDDEIERRPADQQAGLLERRQLVVVMSIGESRANRSRPTGRASRPL